MKPVTHPIWRRRFGISPGLIAGSGLKLSEAAGVVTIITQISPGLIAGSGLKQYHDHPVKPGEQISPGLIAGSGLKLRKRPVCMEGS